MVLRHLIKDSAIYGGADFFSKCILFLAYPVVAAALSPRAFGALELIGTTTMMLGLVMNCGLNNATQRFYWDKDTGPEQRPVMVSSGLIALVGLGVLTMSLGLLSIPVISPFVQESGLPLTWVAMVAALFLMGFNQWLQFVLDVLRLQFAPWRFMAVSMLFRVGGAIAGVVAVAGMGWGVDGLLSVQAIAALAVFPLAIYFIRTDLTRRLDRAWVVELMKFGCPFIFMGLAYWLFGSMDRWMLASMASVEEVGIYSVAFRFSTIVLFVSGAFGQAWSPIAIKIRTDDPRNYRQIYANVLLLLLYVMLAVGGCIALFSGELISMIMPNEYGASALPLTILCFSVAIQATQHVTAIGISLEKKTYLFARLAWITAIVNFFLNLLLIPDYGATGAALATMISHVILTSFYIYFTQIVHFLPISWKKLCFLLGLGGFVGCVAVAFCTSTISWSIVAIKLLFAFICLGTGWMSLPFRSFYFGR